MFVPNASGVQAVRKGERNTLPVGVTLSPVPCEMDAVSKQRNVLAECYGLLGQLPMDVADVGGVLERLNGCSFAVQFVSSRDADVLLVRLIKALPCVDDGLVSGLCLLVSNICTKQQVTLEDKTLHTLLEYLLRCLRLCSPWVLPAAVDACGALIYANMARLEPLWEPLLASGGALETLLRPDEPDGKLRLAALRTLGAMTVKGEPPLPDWCTARMLDLLLDCLTDTHCPDPSVPVEALMTSALKSLQKVFSTKWGVRSDQLGRLLGVLKHLSFHGFPGQKSVRCPSLVPSPLCLHLPVPQIAEQFRPVTPKKRRRRHRKAQGDEGDTAQDVESSGKTSCKGASSSDSEFSDSESGQLARQRHQQSSVRRHVYLALRALVKAVDCREMFSYWLHFLPDIPVTLGAPQTQTILLTILRDPNPQVRTVALELLTDIMSHYKPFLGLASHSGVQRTAFRTLSETVAAILGEVHRCLHLALIAESCPAQTVQLLKCLAAVVSGSPYHRLQAGLLTRLVGDVAALLDHRDLQVQVGSLTVLGAVVGMVPVSRAEVEASLRPQQLLAACASKLLVSDEAMRISSTVVRVEALQLLTLLFQGSLLDLRESADKVVAVVRLCLLDAHLAIQLHAIKLLGAFSRELSTSLAAVSCTEEAQSLLKLGLDLWLTCALEGSLQRCLQDDSLPVLQAEACSCLASVGSQVWDALPEDRRLVCITLVLALAKDGVDTVVRNAAIRCLGNLCAYASLREDLLFLMDVGDVVLEALGEPSLRMKASWTLSNLTEMLADLRKQGSRTEVPAAFLSSLGTAALSLQKDKNHAQANAVRSLGCLLQFFTKDHLGREEIGMLVIKSVDSLIQGLHAGLMKVRWNACYSLGSMLANEDIVAGTNVRPVLDALLGSLVSCSNLKVRIQAATALCAPRTRAAYGSELATVWRGLLAALEAADQPVDYRELQHQNQLRDQLCLSICHLLALAEAQDISEIESATRDYEGRILNAFKKAFSKEVIREGLKRAHDNLARESDDPCCSKTTRVLLASLLKGDLAELQSQMHALEVK